MALVLVLGANGFLGAHVARSLARDSGLTVAGAGLGAAPDRFDGEWLDIDVLAAPDRLRDEIARLGPRCVVNLVGATAGSPETLRRLNITATEIVLAALDTAAPGARLVHFGSAAEYGAGPVGVPVTEGREPDPRSEYGITKLAGTRLVTAWVGAADSATPRRDATVLRVFNPLAPGMPPDSLPGAALRRLREAVAAGEPRIEMGPLDAVRDFVDVRDVASAVAAACLHDGPVPPIVNIASGTGHATRELVDAIARAAGFTGAIHGRAAGSSRSDYVPWVVADISLAALALGWRPAHDLASSVAAMVAGEDA